MMMTYSNGHAAFHQPRIRAIYTNTTAPQCEKAFMSLNAFRVLLRSVAGSCRGGRFINEDGVQLYGWRIREQDGSLSAIITDVIESSPHSRRSSVTFDVDYDYATHRDHYLRDIRCQKNFNLLGYIHSHPDRLIHFSQTDLNTMAEYTQGDMEVMLSGLVTLCRGELELTMYAVTQSGNQMYISNLPLLISDEEVNRRLPTCGEKPFDQIWREASGTNFTPRFRMLDVNKVFLQQTAVSEKEEEKKAETRVPIDTSAIPEGAEGSLCGRMCSGTLQLYLQPAIASPKPQQEVFFPEFTYPVLSGKNRPTEDDPYRHANPAEEA